MIDHCRALTPDLVDTPMRQSVSGNIQQAKDEVSLPTCVQRCSSSRRHKNSAHHFIILLYTHLAMYTVHLSISIYTVRHGLHTHCWWPNFICPVGMIWPNISSVLQRETSPFLFFDTMALFRFHVLSNTCRICLGRRGPNFLCQSRQGISAERETAAKAGLFHAER